MAPKAPSLVNLSVSRLMTCSAVRNSVSKTMASDRNELIDYPPMMTMREASSLHTTGLKRGANISIVKASHALLGAGNGS